MESLKNAIVCITGASSGIGMACAESFAREGSALLLFARRRDRLDALSMRLQEHHGVRVLAQQLDVRDREQVAHVFAALPQVWRPIDVLVNNAGLSRGLDRLQEGAPDDWEEMIDTNIKGLLFVTRAVVPGMVARNRGHVINIGSIAGHQVYAAGNVYCATKHAVNALTQGLKLDLLGTNVRVSTVDPGLVETEFSEVRFHGDKVRAAKTYVNTRPLTPEDVAEVIVFCATRPLHVDIAEVIVLPTDQASVHHVHRTG
jgi:3-hydroxy acid dehydrogenase/malonic semialdehyde reductase